MAKVWFNCAIFKDFLFDSDIWAISSDLTLGHCQIGGLI